MSRLILLIVLALVAGTAPAAAQEPAADPLRGDPRLDRKVRLRVEGLALSDLLARIQAKTGVRMAGTRQTADEKVVLFGPERPLREWMADLAALLNDRWTRVAGKPGEPEYTLTRDSRAEAYEARLARTAIERLMARMEEQVRALAETPEQLARRPEQDFVRRLLSDEETRFPTEVYAALGREQREALFVRRRLNVAYASLHPRHQAAFRKVFTERLAQMEEFVRTDARFREAREKGQPIRGLDRVENLDRSSIRFRVQHVGGTVLVLMALGVSPIRSQIEPTEDGKSQLTASLGCWPVAMLDAGSAWVLPAHGDPYTGAAVPGAASLPGAEMVRDAARDPEWIDRLRRLSEKSGQPVLADLYRSRPVVRPPDETPAGEAERTAPLDGLCHPTGYLWWTRGTTLLFRKRDWYTQRHYEVPDSWLDAQVARFQPARLATIGDALRLLELTPEQIAGLESLREGSYVSDADGLAGLRELLTMVRTTPGAAGRSLPSRTEGAGRASAPLLTFRSLTLLQRSMLPELADREDRALSPGDLEAFTAQLYGSAPADGPRGYRALPVAIDWAFGGDPTQLVAGLPLSFPDDRRAVTVVEVVPG